jgi:hypothetical protein
MIQSIQSSDDLKKQVLNIIERIEKINALITLHLQEEEDDFMIRQYTFRKSRLLQDLQDLLESLNIKVDLRLAA